MNTVLRAFLLFAILLVLALLLGQAGSIPVPISVQLGTLSLQTTAPVGITLVVAILLLSFYAGRFTGWLLRLPRHLHNHRKQTVAETLADAYTAYTLADFPTATKLVNSLKPEALAENAAYADLASLLALQLGQMTPQHAQKLLENPRLVVPAALFLARFAAAQENWTEVRRVTIIGRRHAPGDIHLLALQFKALVNLNDPLATELLPALKTPLGPQRHKLVTGALQGPNALTARPLLDSPWIKAFQEWLPTPSDTFPAE